MHDQYSELKNSKVILQNKCSGTPLDETQLRNPLEKHVDIFARAN